MKRTCGVLEDVDDDACACASTCGATLGLRFLTVRAGTVGAGSGADAGTGATDGASGTGSGAAADGA